MKRHSKKGNRETTKLWKKENSAFSALFYCFMPSFNPADCDKYKIYELEKKCYEDRITQ